MENEVSSLKDVAIHICTVTLMMAFSSLYSKSLFMTKYIPYIYALISYYAHTVFIFRGVFDVEGTESQRVEMSKDDLFRHIILFAALCFNLVYIGVFLVFNKRDCIILNILTFSLFIKDMIMQPGKSRTSADKFR